MDWMVFNWLFIFMLGKYPYNEAIFLVKFGFRIETTILILVFVCILATYKKPTAQIVHLQTTGQKK